MTNEIFLGKLETENSHVRFDEGGIASAKSRRESLLYKKVLLFLGVLHVSLLFGLECTVEGRSWYYLWHGLIDDAFIITSVSPCKGDIEVPAQFMHGGSKVVRVVEVQAGCFKGQKELVSISIPNGVKIQPHAFDGCTALKTVNLPADLESIPDYAFAGCISLANINIPRSVKTIGHAAFMGSGLKSISIPNSVTEIQSSAFSGCMELADVTLPESLTELGGGVFSGCTSLRDIVSLPKGITSISGGLFQDCIGLTEVAIPDHIVAIGDCAFAGCENLSSVTIPKSVVEIYGTAFTRNAATFVVFFNGPPPARTCVYNPIPFLEELGIGFFREEYASEWARELVFSSNTGYYTWSSLYMFEVESIAVAPKAMDWQTGTFELEWSGGMSPYTVYCSAETNGTDEVVVVGCEDTHCYDELYSFRGDMMQPIYYTVVGADGSQGCCIARRRYALAAGYSNTIVSSGVSQFEAEEFISLFKSSGAVLDVQNDAKVLIDEDASTDSIRKELSRLSTVVRPGDIFAFYVCTHGDTNKCDGIQTGPCNAKGEVTKESTYSADQLKKDIGYIGEKDALSIVIINACGSGKMAKKMCGAKNSAWITATSDNEESVIEPFEEGLMCAGKPYTYFGMTFLEWGWKDAFAVKDIYESYGFAFATYYDLADFTRNKFKGESSNKPYCAQAFNVSNLKYAYAFVDRAPRNIPTPEPPQNLKFEMVGAGAQVTLKWDACSDVDYYKVYGRKHLQDSCSQFDKWKCSPVTSCRVNNLTYSCDFCVVSVNANGESAPSDIIRVAPPNWLDFIVDEGTLSGYEGEMTDGCKVNIPKSVTVIGEEVFKSCSNMEMLTIPASVTKIGCNAFLGCSGLSLVCVNIGETERVRGMLSESGFDVSRVTFVEVKNVEDPMVVHFDAGDGSCDESIRIVEKGGAIGVLPTAIRPKHRFDGWFTKASGGEKITVKTAVTGDVTYYAHWTYDGKVSVLASVARGCEGRGDVSGAKSGLKAGAKVTLKATTSKGYAFAGWYADVQCNQRAVGNVDYRTSSFACVAGEDDVVYYAKFVTVAEDAAKLSVANIAEGDAFTVNDDWQKKIEVNSYSLPSVSVKGLPSGLKFDAKALTISGKPTKPGTYVVELSLKNASVKTAKKHTFKIIVPNLESGRITGGVSYKSDAYTYVAGTQVAPILPALEDGWTLKASGLPSGLKLTGGKNGAPYAIEGAPTAKPGSYTVTLNLTKGKEKDVATITINIENRTLALVVADCEGSHTNGCKVSGGGSYAAGKKVTLKATATAYKKATAKTPEQHATVFAGWYRDSGCTVPLEGVTDFRTTSYGYVTKAEDETIYAKFISATADTMIGLTVNGEDVVDDSGDVRVVVRDAATLPAIELVSVSIPKVSAKGLPAGMKWDAKANRFTGAPTKPGIYKISVSLTNTTVKKAIVRAFTVEVPNFVSPAFPGLKPESDAYPMSVGVSKLPNVDAGLAPGFDGYTIKVAGLPSGLSFKNGVLAGLAKKAGDYTVTFTATKGKDKQVSTITLHVEALPDWAVGTFVGMVRQIDRDEGGAIIKDEDGRHDWYDILTTVSVTSAGKVSGKMHFESGTEISFKYDSISERTDDGYLIQGRLTARGIAAEVEFLLRKVWLESTGVGEVGAVDVTIQQSKRQEGKTWIDCEQSTFSTDEDMPLRQNVWTSKTLPLPPNINGVKETVPLGDDVYTLAFGKNGSVKVSLAKVTTPTKSYATGTATLSILRRELEVWHCELCTSLVVKKNDYGATCVFDVTISANGTVTCTPR